MPGDSCKWWQVLVGIFRRIRLSFWSRKDSSEELVYRRYLKSGLAVALWFEEKGCLQDALDVLYGTLIFLGRQKEGCKIINEFIKDLRPDELPDPFLKIIFRAINEAKGSLPDYYEFWEKVKDRLPPEDCVPLFSE